MHCPLHRWLPPVLLAGPLAAGMLSWFSDGDITRMSGQNYRELICACPVLWQGPSHPHVSLESALLMPHHSGWGLEPANPNCACRRHCVSSDLCAEGSMQAWVCQLKNHIAGYFNLKATLLRNDQNNCNSCCAYYGKWQANPEKKEALLCNIEKMRNWEELC